MKGLKLLLILGAVLVLCGCPEPHKPNTLSVTPSELSFNWDDSQEKMVVITTDAKEWAYQVVPSDWVTTRKEENILYVRVAENRDNNNARSAVITFTAGDAPAVPVVVNQGLKPKDDLSIDKSALEFNANETAEQVIRVTTNAPNWDTEKDPEASWITITKANNEIRVKVAAYTSTSTDRSATVTVKGGDADPVSFKVTQKRRNTLSVSPSSLNFAYNATTSQKLTVTTNASSWSVSRPSSVDWISYSMNGNELNVSVQTNPNTSSRSVDLTFEAGSANAVKVTVTQNPNPGTPPPTYAQVRFRKSSNNSSLYEMAVWNINFTQLAYYQFGTSTGTTGYYNIPAGNHLTLINEGGTVYILTWGSSNAETYTFQANRKYTFEYDGSSYWMRGDGYIVGAPELAPAPIKDLQPIKGTLKKSDNIKSLTP